MATKTGTTIDKTMIIFFVFEALTSIELTYSLKVHIPLCRVFQLHPYNLQHLLYLFHQKSHEFYLTDQLEKSLLNAENHPQHRGLSWRWQNNRTSLCSRYPLLVRLQTPKLSQWSVLFSNTHTILLHYRAQGLWYAIITQ